MTGYEGNQYSYKSSCLPEVRDAGNLLSTLKPLLMLGISQDQRKLEFIRLQSGSTGKGNNTPKLDLKVVQSFCNILENFCFSQAGIQDSPQDYSLYVAFYERELNLDSKNLSYISVLTCISFDCNFSPMHPNVTSLFLRVLDGSPFSWISSATTTIQVTWKCNISRAASHY